MKKVLFYILILTICINASCKKTTDDGPVEIYGKWKLTETMWIQVMEVENIKK